MNQKWYGKKGKTKIWARSAKIGQVWARFTQDDLWEKLFCLKKWTFTVIKIAASGITQMAIFNCLLLVYNVLLSMCDEAISTYNAPFI
jgi:hypothetical protein